MAIPFLPADLIQQTYNLLKSPNLPDDKDSIRKAKEIF